MSAEDQNTIQNLKQQIEELKQQFDEVTKSFDKRIGFLESYQNACHGTLNGIALAKKTRENRRFF